MLSCENAWRISAARRSRRGRTTHKVPAGQHEGEHDDAGDGLRGLGHRDDGADQEAQALRDLRGATGASAAAPAGATVAR